MKRPANDNIPGQLIPLMPDVVERLWAAADFLEATGLATKKVGDIEGSR